jgi:succinyl-CoA synthetase beta subunit
MDLLEYQGKQLFARHGVPVPAGKPASTVQDAIAAADEIGYPCAVKAQVQIGGRGKLGSRSRTTAPRPSSMRTRSWEWTSAG